MSTLRVILGDQLSSSISTLINIKSDDVILMAEVKEEATYVKHHKKKIAFVFSAMRHFADELQQKGHSVRYISYTDPDNSGSLCGEVKRLLRQEQFDCIVITEPGEYRLLHEVQRWEKKLKMPVEILSDNRFIAAHDEFAEWAEGRKELVMEYWYRLMRKKTGLLMDGEKPVGGKWNYDQDNRKPLKKKVAMKGPMRFFNDTVTTEVIMLVDKQFANHFGELQPFWYAVSAKQAKRALSHFIKHQLPYFGDYQDAMLSAEPFLFHSVISHYINCGLLDPISVCKKAEAAYNNGHAPLNAVEGFIRQIIGWREYIRGIYWRYMPEYAERNTLNATRPLPGFYWHAETEMKCMSESIRMTKDHAYSHHIQRLMITGNFANLAGLDVKQVCDWYLAVYADAYEWVELPNTLGMALHGDDGVVGTKPYISSGSYINRMSNFCRQCSYDFKQRVGEDACPFTNLYWDYLIRHQKRFRGNRRMAMAYRNLDRFSKDEISQIKKQASSFLLNLK
jgi:deoxyribodipyrimidine photolyase-related protein